tara:strand:+ start:689 stop:892 length:204 start_codon:yes stop_codon:yes gene_type:complete
MSKTKIIPELSEDDKDSQMMSNFLDAISNEHKEYWENNPLPKIIEVEEMDELPRVKMYNETKGLFNK